MLTAYSLLGNLDIESLVRSFSLIVERHDALRLRIYLIDGIPRQTITSPNDFKIELIDLSNNTNPRELAGTLIENLASRAEDLGSRYLFEVKLLKIDCREHALILRIDHIISDAWSGDILYRELSLLYRAFLERRNVEGLYWPAQYSEYIAWQEDWFSSEDSKKHIDYVSDAVAASKSMVPPETPKPTASGKPFSIGVCELTESHLSKLNKYAFNNGTTLSCLLTAIYAYALSRWSGIEELVIYSVFNGRRQKRFRHTFGCFAHSILFRMNLHKTIQFADALKIVSKSTITGYVHHGAMSNAIPEGPACLINFNFANENPVRLALDGLKTGRIEIPPNLFVWDNFRLQILTYMIIISRITETRITLLSNVLSEDALTPFVLIFREQVEEVLAG